ncbi:MAG TPA: hypothetical protein VKG21_07740 [Casimicrobiaceae bacterium]|nr:hypothetical protein [Casimicrobiaceae bacterium]
MSLAGKGAVAIWHDIAPEGRDEFYKWHGLEHMPERAGIPGFLRGRRYVAIDGEPEYFNLYETDSLFAVTGPDYLARLNNPTPWTVATVRHFRGVARSLCHVAASFGEGQGGLMATFRYGVADALAESHRRKMAQQVLPALVETPGIAGSHLLIADEAASAVETAEKKVRSEKNLIPRWIVLAESWGDVDVFVAACCAMLKDGTFADIESPPALGVYRLQNSRCKFAWSPG